VDPFDIASIRRGFVKVLTNPRYRDELIFQGIRNVERFRPGRIARMYCDLYQEIWSRELASNRQCS
jgi:hypothetical protein